MVLIADVRGVYLQDNDDTKFYLMKPNAPVLVAMSLRGIAACRAINGACNTSLHECNVTLKHDHQYRPGKDSQCQLQLQKGTKPFLHCNGISFD